MNLNSNPGNLKLLHRNEMGYVARCKCCEEVQVGIGNIVVHLNFENFQRFWETFKWVRDHERGHSLSLPNGEKILMRTPVKSLLLSFSREEFEETLELIGQAWVLLEANEIVK